MGWGSPDTSSGSSGGWGTATGSAASQSGGGGGWSWNPLTDFMKATSSAGSWVDSHIYKWSGFNPGVGSLTATALNAVPGMYNLGIQTANDLLHGDPGKAASQIGDVASQMGHGLLDTSTDITTLGGFAPWTKWEQSLQDNSIYGQHGNTLKTYSTTPGQGAGGALFNDAANIAMVADGAGALAKLGEVGKAAEAARAAEVADSVAKAGEAGASAEDIANAGATAREARIQEAVDAQVEQGADPEIARQRIENRMKMLNRIDAVRSSANYILQPWTAMRPLERYAGSLYDRGPVEETAATSETPSEAPQTPSEPSPASGASQAAEQPQAATQPASQGGSLFSEAFGPTTTTAEKPSLDDLTKEFTAQETKRVQGEQEQIKAQPGSVTLYRGERPNEGSFAVTDTGVGKEGEPMTWYTDNAADARTYAGPDGKVLEVTVPKEVAADAIQPHQIHTEDFEARGNTYDLGGARAEWDDKARTLHAAAEPTPGQPAEAPPVEAPEPAGSEPSSPKTAEAKVRGIAAQLADVPRAVQSYLEWSKGVSKYPRIARWAKNIVDRLPAPAVSTLQWMDAHHQKLDYQAMTRQQQRALAAEARRIENLPEVQAAYGAAREVLQQRLEGVTPTVANNIVGQLIRAYITHGKDAIEELEGKRAEAEEAMPGKGSLLLDSELGYSFHIPDLLNTPEFRQQIYDLADPIRQLRLDASERMRNSQMLADKGLTNQDIDMPLLTKGERRAFNRAQHKLQQALKLEQNQVPKQLEGKAREKAQLEDVVGKAIETSHAAMESMVEARTDFDRSRYVPESINTPQKLQAATDEIAARTVRNSGATYNPTTGKFIEMADGHTQGYLVGALPDSVVTMPLAEFMQSDPVTGRLHGANVLDNMIHGYQEALAYPDITVGTWVDDDGMVHIDPSQFLQGESARDHAITLGAIRGQDAIKEVHTGDDIPIRNDPNVSAYFVKDHAARDARAAEARAIIDKQIAAGGAGMSEDDIDRWMAMQDRTAVTMHLLHPDEFKKADDYYKTFKVQFADRASPNALALNEIRQKISSKGQILKIVRPLMQAANGESRWYFTNHDYIEKIGAQLPDVKLGLGTPWSNARTVSGKDLLYSLVAIHSINASPSENMASALAAFRNFTQTDVRKLAGAIKQWSELPQDQRVPRSGKWEDMPEPIKSLMKDSNQVARRQTMAVLDGHTLDTWDDNFIRDVFPQYGNKEGAALPLRMVTEAEKANTVDLQHAIMEHFGSSAQAKLRSFWENLRDPENSMSVTLDSHMARAFGEQDTFWNGPNWFKHAQMIREVAADLSAETGRKVMPHEVQAALWYWVKNQHASVQVAATRADILDSLARITKGTWSRETDAHGQFMEMLRQEAHEQRPEGQLTEKRKMRFVDQPLGPNGEGKASPPRTVEWRRTAAKADGTLSKPGESLVKQADDYQAVLDKVEEHVNAGRPEMAKGVLLDYMGKQERTLARRTKGENFWDAENKDITPQIADQLDIGLPGPMALNEFRDHILGQFVPSTRVQGGLIRLFSDADLATLTHESGHLLRALTTGDDLRALEQAYGVTGGRWTSEAEEAFVHDFLAHAAEDTEGPMSNLKDVLAQAYGDFAPAVHPEIDNFWQKVLAPNIERTSVPGFELSTGEKMLGFEGKNELGKTMQQRQAMVPTPEGTKLQTYKRGAAGEEAIENWRLAAKQKRIADAAAARAQKHVDRLAQEIQQRLVPAQATADLLRRQATGILDKLGDRLEDPAQTRLPAKWQPLMTTAKKIATDIEHYPELEPILGDFPETFGQMLDYANEHGFDPAYMPDLKPEDVKRLIAGTAKLGAQGTAQMGKEFTSGARRARRGTLQRIGAYDNSIDALVAGLNQATQEERTNMIVNWIDRTVARDLPVDAAGRRLGAPPGWVEWDDTRRGLLAVTTPQGERVAVGATKMIPRVVDNAIREYAGPPPTNPIYRGLKMMTDPWRALMLTANPGFYLKHFQGHILLAAISGGLDMRNWLEAFKSMRNGYKDVPELTGLNIAYAEGKEPSLFGYSRVRDGGMREAWQAGGPTEVSHLIAQKLHSVIAVSDTFARAVAYYSKLPKDRAPTAYERQVAMQYAHDALIDYGNLSNTERYWVRSVIPFYSFSKGILKLATRMPLDHPLATATLMSVAKWQEEQAVDDQGNPLPERYQGVVDLPLLGKVDMQKYNPFRDVEAFTTPDGLVSSLQYAIQDVVRAGLGVPAPGTKAGTKIDKYGRLVPDVTPQSQIVASFAGSPQGQLLQGNSNLEKFFGIPVVSQSTLNKAGQANVISQAEMANTTTAQQQQAAAFPVDTQAMQQNLQKAISSGAAVAPTNPQTGNQLDMNAIQQLVQQKVADQQAKAAQTRAQNQGTGPQAPKAPKAPTLKKGGGSARHTGTHHVSSGGNARRARGPKKISRGGSSSHTFQQPKVKSKLRQGFGKATNTSFKTGRSKATKQINYGGRGVVGKLHLGRKTVRR